MTKVLIVDDSALLRKILSQILSRDPELEVVGFAESGEAAIRFLEKNAVDVVTMDIQMPGMDGFETTRRIMESSSPVPVVIISSCWNPQEVEKTFEAMDAGAVAILPKPATFVADMEEYCEELLKTLRGAAISKVSRLRRRKPSRFSEGPRAPEVLRNSAEERLASRSAEGKIPGRQIRLVAVGASTGGPQALAEFLARLPATFSPPLLVVQHIAPGFTPGLVEWLGKTTPLPVRIAQNGRIPEDGVVHVAPDGFHLGVRSGGIMILSGDPPEHMVRPSASWLFRTVAAVHGGEVAAILFSGMGKDGAAEMKTLRSHGAVTFAQDKESSVVWGMPGEAVRLDAAEHVASPSAIASLLADLVRLPKNGPSSA